MVGDVGGEMLVLTEVGQNPIHATVYMLNNLEQVA